MTATISSSLIQFDDMCEAFGPRRVINELSMPVPARSVSAFLGNNG